MNVGDDKETFPTKIDYVDISPQTPQNSSPQNLSPKDNQEHHQNIINHQSHLSEIAIHVEDKSSLTQGIILDEDDSDLEEDNDIYYIRKKENQEEKKIPISELNPINTFVLDPNNNWGKNYDNSSDSSYFSDDDSHIGTPRTPRTPRGNRSPTSFVRDSPSSAEKRGRGRSPVVRNKLLDRIRGNRQNSPKLSPLRNISGPRSLSGGPRSLSGSRSRSKPRHIIRSNLIFDEEINRNLNIRAFTAEELNFETKKRNKIIQSISNIFSSIEKYTTKPVFNYFKFLDVTTKVEQRFGTGVASYFGFWKSMIIMNLSIFLCQTVFLIIPWILRTDFSLTQKLSPLFEFEFWQGLVGITAEDIGSTFFLFGGYRPTILLATNTTIGNTTTIGSTSIHETYYDSILNRTLDNTPFSTKLMGIIPYDFRVFYPLSIFVYFFLCLGIIVLAIGERLKVVITMDKNIKLFSTCFSSFDFSISSKRSISSQKTTFTSQLLEFIQAENQHLQLTHLQNNWKSFHWSFIVLILRRIIGVSISLLILIGAPFGIAIVSGYYSELNNIFFLTSSLILSVLNLILPKILSFCVVLENWNDEKLITINKIFRTYIIKLSSFIALTVRVLFTNISADKCVPNEAGILFWQSIFIDLITSSGSVFIVNYLKLCVNKKKKKAELDIVGGVNKLLYLQSVIWIGTIVSPVLPLLASCSSIIMFFLTIFVMFKTMRFPKKPIVNSQGSIYNHVFLLVTLLLTLIPIICFFLINNFACGPSFNGNLIDGFMIWKLYKDSNLVNFLDNVLDIVTWAIFVGLVVCLILLYLMFQKYVVRGVKKKIVKKKIEENVVYDSEFLESEQDQELHFNRDSIIEEYKERKAKRDSKGKSTPATIVSSLFSTKIK